MKVRCVSNTTSTELSYRPGATEPAAAADTLRVRTGHITGSRGRHEAAAVDVRYKTKDKACLCFMTNLPPDYINQNLAVIQRKHHSVTALCSCHRPHGLNAELQGCVHIEKVNAASTKEKEKGENMLSVRTPPSSTNIFIGQNSYQFTVNSSLRFHWTHLVFTLQQDKTFTQPSLRCCICSTSGSDWGHNDFFSFCC